MSHHYLCPLRWADLDAQGHVNNAAYLDYLQDARVDFLLTGPPGMAELLATGVLVVSHQVEYLAPLVYSERPLDIDLWVESVGASRFAVAYEVRHGDVLAARARTTAAPYDLAASSLRRLHPQERQALTDHRREHEILPTIPRLRWAEGGHRYPLTVRWSDLDAYGHVNNVKYYDYVQEARIALMAQTLGWSGDEIWVVVRQDVAYHRPMDFSLTPYEVVTVVSKIGNRSFTLAAEVRDPADGSLFATATSVVVSEQPLTDEQRTVLATWIPAEVAQA